MYAKIVEFRARAQKKKRHFLARRQFPKFTHSTIDSSRKIVHELNVTYSTPVRDVLCTFQSYSKHRLRGVFSVPQCLRCQTLYFWQFRSVEKCQHEKLDTWQRCHLMQKKMTGEYLAH